MPLTHPMSLPWAPFASQGGHLLQDGRNWTLVRKSNRNDQTREAGLKGGLVQLGRGSRRRRRRSRRQAKVKRAQTGKGDLVHLHDITIQDTQIALDFRAAVTQTKWLHDEPVELNFFNCPARFPAKEANVISTVYRTHLNLVRTL